MATRRRFNQATAPQPEQRFPRAQRPSQNLFPLASSNMKRGGRLGTSPGLPSITNPPATSIPGGTLPPGPYHPAPMPTPPDRDTRPPIPREPPPPAWGDQDPRIPGYQGDRGGQGLDFDSLWDTYQKLPPRTQQEFLREHPAFAYRIQQNVQFNQPQSQPHDGRDPRGPYGGHGERDPRGPYGQHGQRDPRQPLAPHDGRDPQPYGGQHGGRDPQVPYIPPQVPPTGQPAPMPIPPGPGVPPVPMPLPPGPGVPPPYQPGGNAYDYFQSLGGGVDALTRVIPGSQVGGLLPPGATVIANGPDGTPIWMDGAAWDALSPDLKALAGNVSAGGQLAGVYNPNASGFGGYDPSIRGDIPQAPGSVASQAPPQPAPPTTMASQAPSGPATMSSPGAAVFADSSWGGSGGAGGKGGTPISPQFEYGRRILEDQLSQTLADIGVQEAEIPVTLKLIQARLKADEEESMRQISETTNARGTYASGGTQRDFALSGRGFERSRRDAQMEAARALGELARRKQGARSDYLKGLSDLLLQWQPNAEGERSNDDEEPSPPGKKPPQSKGGRKRNRSKLTYQEWRKRHPLAPYSDWKKYQGRNN